MSWYFLGGFSAYCTVPSGRQQEPLRVLLDLGVVRRALEGDIQGNLDVIFLGFGHQVLEILQGAELRVDGLVPPSSEPMAQGVPGSPGPAVTALFLPLRLVWPMGWMGGR